MAKILVVDDEQQIQEVIIDVLHSVGHEAMGVSDGISAFEVLQNQGFDLALVDVMMPRMNGYELIAKIHGLPNPPKVIVVTARNFDVDQNTLNTVGAEAFISKPFSNKELLEVITKILR